MNTGWKEIEGDILKPKLKDIYSQETSTWWKRHNNRIWFQIKNDDMMELDRIWYVECKSRNWNPALCEFHGIVSTYCWGDNPHYAITSWRISLNLHLSFTVLLLWSSTVEISFSWIKWVSICPLSVQKNPNNLHGWYIQIWFVCVCVCNLWTVCIYTIYMCKFTRLHIWIVQMRTPQLALYTRGYMCVCGGGGRGEHRVCVGFRFHSGTYPRLNSL